MNALKNYVSIFGIMFFIRFILSFYNWVFKVHKASNIRIQSLPEIQLYGTLKIGSGVRLGKNIKFKVGRNSLLQIDNGASIGSNVRITVPDNELVSIGKNSRLNDDCMVVDRVKIGNNVVISNRVQLISFDHQLFQRDMSVDEADQKLGILKREILVGDGVFIGANALLFGSCEIQQYCTISAGAVISNKSFPSNHIILSANHSVEKN